MRIIRTRMTQALVDALVICVALTVAYAIRFQGVPPGVYLKQFFLILPYLVMIRLLAFSIFGVYRLIWRYISFRDLPRIAGAVLVGSLALLATRFFAVQLFSLVNVTVLPVHASVPYWVMLVEAVLSTTGVVSVRAIWRLTQEEMQKTTRLAEPLRAILIGAGEAGVMVAREVSSKPWFGLRPVAFLDDDSHKHGRIIQGIRVRGGTELLPKLAWKLDADVAIVTIGNASPENVRRIIDLAESTSLKIQLIPPLNDIITGRVAISKFRDVDIEDLLGRDPVDLDKEQVQEFITGKTVMVTGAGGSIGSEICRQVCHFAPKALIMVDQAENPIFHTHRALLDEFPTANLNPLIGNITSKRRMHYLLSQTRPDVIFHAAAHKHVPLMEDNPSEAIRNNVEGTRVMADLAHEFSVDAFVMISTDKAVNPTSVMGATKRLAEIYILALATESSTRFTTVRFGNVLGSEGSVIPIFKEQIAMGGPVKVTHPEMKRYFMTIPEASQLVLQASTMGKGGEIFVLEMGEPIKIIDLARDLIRLSGFQPDKEIEISIVGIRPGEKLYEEINLSEENATKTRHPRIWIGRSTPDDLKQATEVIDRLLANLNLQSPEELRASLAASVPEYHPEGVKSRYEP